MAAPIDENRPASVRPPGMKIVTDESGSGPFHPSPSLDGAFIKAIEHYEENAGYLGPALNAFSTAHESLKAIDNARQMAAKNPAWHPWQQLLNVASFAEKKRDLIHRTFDKAHNDLRAAEQMLEQSLSAPLESVTHTAICQEIRSHVRSLSDKERGEFVHAALKNGDMKVLNSVLGAPAYLSGINQHVQAMHLRSYQETKNPTAVRRLAATRDAIRLLEQRAPIAYAQVEQAMGGTFRKAQQLREADSEARKALLMTQNDVE